jgi:hypothetical protein
MTGMGSAPAEIRRIPARHPDLHATPGNPGPRAGFQTFEVPGIRTTARPAAPAPASPTLTLPEPALPTLASPTPAPAFPAPALSEPALSEPALSEPALSEPALSALASSAPALASPVLASPAPALSALASQALASQVLASPGLPVLPVLRELLPRGGLARGSVLTVAGFGLLSLALLAGASAAGAWCGIAGIPEAGVLAAAALGLDVDRTLLVPDPGPAWPQVVASLLDGCELVLLRPPGAASAQVRRHLEATLRRGRGALLVAGDWPGAQVRLRVVAQRWTGLGEGHGRLRACRAEVMTEGRGEAAVPRTRWLWLPAEDGSVAPVDPVDIPATPAAGSGRPLRAVNSG